MARSSSCSARIPMSCATAAIWARTAFDGKLLPYDCIVLTK